MHVFKRTAVLICRDANADRNRYVLTRILNRTMMCNIPYGFVSSTSPLSAVALLQFPLRFDCSRWTVLALLGIMQLLSLREVIRWCASCFANTTKDWSLKSSMNVIAFHAFSIRIVIYKPYALRAMQRGD